MHIPLDYYRILGLPVQATAEQVRQAHYDRTLQRPKWDYSELAIAARKSLLDDAFNVLSHQGQRQQYDAQVLPQALDHPTQPSDPTEADTYDLDITELLNPDLSESAVPLESQLATPTLEITDEQLIGALIIYLELSEYELVLNLSQLYGKPAHFQQLQLAQPHTIREDLVLAVAIASTELGREQWKHGYYETAAESLQLGLTFLENHQLLPEFSRTLETELYKLRPYRILELLALPDLRHPDRQRGLQLLQDMLTERQGIDGLGNDRSGLDTDDFLRFIQQLRGYLTADEQIDLFADRFSQSSAVAAYLQIYALIGKGFANHQPELIRQASQSLQMLASRQDVHLEQAICCLLLGQTQLSYRLLENSQEPSVQQFMQAQSVESDDFLPGLCRYVEHWLQQEVLPYCRGLNRLESRLNPYFEDPAVQTDLEQYLARAEWQMTSSYNNTAFSQAGLSQNSLSQNSLSQADWEGFGENGSHQTEIWSAPAAETVSSRQATTAPVPTYAAQTPMQTGSMQPPTWQDPEPLEAVSPGSRSRNLPPKSERGSRRPLGNSGQRHSQAQARSSQSNPAQSSSSRQQHSPPARSHASAQTLASAAGSGVATMTRPTTELSFQGQTSAFTSPEVDYATRSTGDLSTGFVTTSNFSPPSQGGAGANRAKADRTRADRAETPPRSRTSRQRSSRKRRRLGLLLVCGIGIGLGAVALSHVFRTSSSPELVGEQLAIQVDTPLFPEWAIPSDAPTPTDVAPNSAASAQLTPEQAKAAIQAWLTAKVEAMGQAHNLQGLETALTGSMLAKWQQTAQQAQREGWYVVYQHELVDNSLKVELSDPQRPRVSAEIREISEDFAQGSSQPQTKREDALVVKYELVFQNGKWRIQNADVIKQG